MSDATRECGVPCGSIDAEEGVLGSGGVLGLAFDEARGVVALV